MIVLGCDRCAFVRFHAAITMGIVKADAPREAGVEGVQHGG